jgi:phage baseplate assembly protein W
MAAERRSFLGTGWRWPTAINSRGGVDLVREADDIYEAILNILQTAPGERVMRPEYGCGIHDFVFAPMDALTMGEIMRHVQQALGRWEPRIEVPDVDVAIDPDDDSRLLITVNYRIKATHDERSLVYPFYVIPEER